MTYDTDITGDFADDDTPSVVYRAAMTSGSALESVTTPDADEPIVITRDHLRSLPGQPRRAPWVYNYTVPGQRPVCYGTSLVSLRDMLKRRYPGVAIVEEWKR